MSPYPIAFAADHAGEGRDRLTTFFRYFVAIPWWVVGLCFALGAAVLAIAAWFAIAFTGRYPQGLYEFNAKAVRMLARTNAFALLLTDELPPFGGDPDDAYPVRVGFAPPKPAYSRVKALLRLVLAIPVVLLGYVQNVIAGVCSTLAWFAIVFTGRMPEGLHRGIRGAAAYEARMFTYLLLLTEDYPPFGYYPDDEQAARSAPYPAA